jgi:cell volume regulation protein A
MMEPLATNLFLLIAGILLALCALASRVATRTGLPLVLIFLVIGMLAGSEGFGGIPFEDYGFTYRMGVVALVLILFDGGLNTRYDSIRSGIAGASVLATIGVLATAAMVAWSATWFGLPWPTAMLLGAIVSSTDAAAVFSVLRGSGLSLRKKVGTTLELESGINDPVAVILVLACTDALATGTSLQWQMIPEAVLQLVVGLGSGLALGFGGRSLCNRVRFISAGLYPVLSIGLAFLAFSIPAMTWGSGFLAVYVCAVVIGNGPLPHAGNLRRVHDGLAWLSQVSMFLLMGLLVFPSRMAEVAWAGITLALFMAFVARPLAVWLCLKPLGFSHRESAYIGWVGLRGAVPILLATIPVLQDIPGSHTVFDIVFFVVVVNSLIPGTTVGPLTRWLGLTSGSPPPPRAQLEIDTQLQLDKSLESYFITTATPVEDVCIRDIPLPEHLSIVMVLRGNDIIAARGSTRLCDGDHVYVLRTAADEELLRLLFGVPETD